MWANLWCCFWQCDVSYPVDNILLQDVFYLPRKCHSKQAAKVNFESQFNNAIKSIIYAYSRQMTSFLTFYLSKTTGKTKDNLKMNESVIDYCAFMVAIVLIRHVVDIANIKNQWLTHILSSPISFWILS